MKHPVLDGEEATHCCSYASLVSCSCVFFFFCSDVFEKTFSCITATVWIRESLKPAKPRIPPQVCILLQCHRQKHKQIKKN